MIQALVLVRVVTPQVVHRTGHKTRPLASVRIVTLQMPNAHLIIMIRKIRIGRQIILPVIAVAIVI